jgi:hypothetical protein
VDADVAAHLRTISIAATLLLSSILLNLGYGGNTDPTPPTGDSFARTTFDC